MNDDELDYGYTGYTYDPTIKTDAELREEHPNLNTLYEAHIRAKNQYKIFLKLLRK